MLLMFVSFDMSYNVIINPLRIKKKQKKKSFINLTYQLTRSSYSELVCSKLAPRTYKLKPLLQIYKIKIVLSSKIVQNLKLFLKSAITLQKRNIYF
jgi:hypothetical protein